MTAVVFLLGCFVGFFIGAFFAIGGIDRAVKMYAEAKKLYIIDNKAYEIKEVK